MSLLLVRLMGQYCFARCRLSASSSVTRVGGRPPPVTWAVWRPALHGGPVRLRPVRATPCCFWQYTLTADEWRRFTGTSLVRTTWLPRRSSPVVRCLHRAMRVIATVFSTRFICVVQGFGEQERTFELLLQFITPPKLKYTQWFDYNNKRKSRRQRCSLLCGALNEC